MGRVVGGGVGTQQHLADMVLSAHHNKIKEYVTSDAYISVPETEICKHVETVRTLLLASG